MLGVQRPPHLRFVVHTHFLGRHLDAAMVRTIVSRHQVFQDGQITQGVLHGEITVQSFLQRTIESFHHAGLGVASGRKMTNVFPFHQVLKSLIVKFFTVVHLQFHRLVSTALFQNLFEGSRHVLPRLGLDRFHPHVLGQHVHHRQQIPVPAIASGNVSHFNQIGGPLFVHTHHQDW